MSRFFVPTEEQLKNMEVALQEYPGKYNVNDYLLMKVVEIIINQGLEAGASQDILKKTFKYFREDPTISSIIGSLYPETIISSEYAKNDAKLLERVLFSKPKSTHNLDYISSFDKSVTTGYYMLKQILSTIRDELKANPKFRFEFERSLTSMENRNNTLQSIFNTSIYHEPALILTSQDDGIMTSLRKIEPYYCMLSEDYQKLSSSIGDYCYNLGLQKDEYIPYDDTIRESKKDKTKRLLKAVDKYHETMTRK